MSTETIHAAALAEVNQEIEELEARLKEARAVAGYHAARVSQHAVPAVPVVKAIVRPLQQSAPATTHASSVSAMKQFEVAEMVLRNSDKPMKTGAIADAMLAMGFEHDDPSKLRVALYTALNRRPDVFESLGNGLWKLREATA